MQETNFLETLRVLAQRAAPKNLLEVMHGSHVWTAGFRWQAAAAGDEILNVEKELEKALPADYCSFLRMYNGAMLYEDVRHGQWGFHLYGTRELVRANLAWQENLRGQWRDHFIAFAESLGDANVLVFDTNRPTSDSTSYAILESSAFDDPSVWACPSRSFREWLDHLVTAQGDKYWYWY